MQRAQQEVLEQQQKQRAARKEANFVKRESNSGHKRQDVVNTIQSSDSLNDILNFDFQSKQKRQ
jgi:hypothetical protein